ncbi:predicted protein [Streptomyces viridosporus ATCC 14672]|uniref:Predicted protein n=1 Tax=Streptomyces viridosporus (strain ATCC 14672 / DSM 40746 / JCM 4963 / KCTC 9882 / NRRL B-12104 / FH 1290) TaxID=566461 RepID=D6A474_STRV1|nr:predicted protein [Streptomyces viridosporus ATCC 14672]
MSRPPRPDAPSGTLFTDNSTTPRNRQYPDRSGRSDRLVRAVSRRRLQRLKASLRRTR